MANNNNYYKFHIFSPGDHISASGHKVSMTKEDMERTTQVFKSNFRVPFILGHSTHNRPDVLPAMGWVKDIKTDEDGELYGLVEATKAGEALIEGNYLNNCSASFYAPDSPVNPNPGSWTLRHLAGLGAEIPALKELDPLLEIIPENFSENSKKSYNWTSFSEDLETGSVSFNDSTKILPSNYEFKSFIKYGSSFRNKSGKEPVCRPGNKRCNGQCIKNSWVCRDKGAINVTQDDQSTAIIKEPGLTNVLPGETTINEKPVVYNNGPKKKIYENKNYNTKTTGSYDVKTPPTPLVPKVPFPTKEELRDKQTEKNLTTGNLKALGALALTLGAEYGAAKMYPDSKQSQQAIKMLAGVATDQILLRDDSTSSQRLQTAFFSGVSKGTELGLTAYFKDNPFAETHAKATAGLLGVMLVDSGVLDIPFDGYANKMYRASSTMASAIREVNYAKKKPAEKVYEDGDYITKEEAQEISKETVAQLLKKVNAANDSASKTSKKVKGQTEMLEWLLEVLGESTDYKDLQNKLKEISKANKRANDSNTNSSFSENTYTYEHSDVPITFTRSEALTLMKPLALCILKSMGLLDLVISEDKKSKAKKASVKDENSSLDAIFSEFLVPQPLNNGLLHSALFGAKPVIKVSEESDFSETKIEGRKRKRVVGEDRTINNGQEFSEDTEQRSPSSNMLKIDYILDNALFEAESKSSRNRVYVKDQTINNGREFSEVKVPAKKYLNKEKKSMSFQERGPERATVRVPAAATIDFKETSEYKSMAEELRQARYSKDLYEVENFAEGLYKEGRLTEGLAKKKELTALLLGLKTNSKSFEFGESSVSDTYSFVTKLLSNIEPVVSFSEIVNGSSPEILSSPKFDGDYSRDSQVMDHKLSILMAQNPQMTYFEALKKLS